MRRFSIFAATVLALPLFAATPAIAVDPLGGSQFNVKTDIDLKALNPRNFYEVIVPLAKREGTVALFDFTNTMEPFFRDHAIPAFQAKYGIKVEYMRGNGHAAARQLIATTNAGEMAPFDVFFASSGTVIYLSPTPAVANIPLHKLVPNGTRLGEGVATVTEGINHGGRYLPFILNQTAMAYNTRFVDGAKVPADLPALASWAKANPRRLAITHPAKGGSGDGFMQTIMLALVKGDACRASMNNDSITPEAAKAFVASDCVAPVWKFYRDLLPSIELTGGNSDTLTLMANGEAWIGTAWEDNVLDYAGRGLLPPTVRSYLLAEGQVGGGDGIYLPSKAKNVAASLLMMDFLVSPEIQTVKFKMTGSRTAIVGMDLTESLPEVQKRYLIPTDQFSTRARPSLPRPIVNAGKDYFQDNLLRK